MGELSSYPDGAFCWVALGTTEMERAKSFYGGLFGWEFEELSGYTTCRLDGKYVAGLHEHPEDEGAHWRSFISVQHVESAAAAARKLGGTVAAEPTELTGAARIHVIREPSGAEVCLWQQAGLPGATLVNEIGTWIWNELVTPSVASAQKFYGDMFGWTSMEVPGDTERVAFLLGDVLIGAAHTPAPGEDQNPRWTVSFRVADADKSVERVQELGGTVLRPPRDIAVARFSVVADPFGAMFTIARSEPFGTLDGSSVPLDE
ncbi:MAG: VOC family protein [Actinomycetota bacterium]